MATVEDIVISGISGRYPECKNIEEFKEALLNGVDLVTEDNRFPTEFWGIPPRTGRMVDIDKFDASFFKMNPKYVEFMDPRHRILCETVYECIIDAGYNPQELRGSNTGVYVGISTFNSMDKLAEQDSSGYSPIGNNMGLAANRISYCFDFKGKSYAMDAACSSALYAMANAVSDIKSGLVDAAIVSAANLLVHPYETLEYTKFKVLSPDGKGRTFSAERNGFVRSEAVVSVILQKKSLSRRVYATVLGVGSNNDGSKQQSIAFPSSEMQSKLMQDVCFKAGVDPNEVVYVEAHGTGTPIGDAQELQAISDTFCKNNTTPLLVGTCKSNMGHAEIASGLCALSKVVIAMETGVIPANLHVHPLDTNLPGVKEGRLKVVDKNVAWTGGIVAVHSLGFGGANAHVVLQPNIKEKQRNNQSPKHRLVQASGRTEEAVNHFLDEVEKNGSDEEFLALVDEIHKMNIENHDYRGYTILGGKQRRGVAKYTKAKPVWFVYGDLGTDWKGVGYDLMNNAIFKNTIKRCAAALEPYNVNLEEILSHSKSVNSAAAVVAVQVALTDILYSLGISPDGVTGHSLGEIACAYADGHITPEDAVLLGFARDFAFQKTQLQIGTLAEVATSKKEFQKLYVSTPRPDFEEKLFFKNNGILSLYHSKYIQDAFPHFYNFAKNIIKTPTLRSSKWISTSLRGNQRSESWSKYNCAEYHTNNLMNASFSDEVYNYIPDDAIVVEFASLGLARGSLKKKFTNLTVLSMTNKNGAYDEKRLLSTIGRLYIAGQQPNLKKIYNAVTYPVSRGTKMLSPLVKWDHSRSWLVPIWTHKDYFGRVISVNISKPQYAYLNGHSVRGRVMMPATGYLVRTRLVHRQQIDNFPVVFEDVKFTQPTFLSHDVNFQFLIVITKQSDFEVFEGGSVVCTGKIYTTKDIVSEYHEMKCQDVEPSEYLPMSSEDAYMACHLKGHLYEGFFQGITECDVWGFQGKIKWNGNFCSFINTMTHMVVLNTKGNETLLTHFIEKLVIEPQKHLELIAKDKDLPIFFNNKVNVIRSGAIEIYGLEFSKVSSRKCHVDNLVLENYVFVPYQIFSSDDSASDSWIAAALQIILQNCSGVIKFGEFADDDQSKLIPKLKQALPMAQAQFIKFDDTTANTVDILVLSEHSLKKINRKRIIKCLGDDGMMLYQGDITKFFANLTVLFQASSGQNGVYLLRPTSKATPIYNVVHINNNWTEQITHLNNDDEKIVCLLSQNEDTTGVVALVKSLSAECTKKFSCVLIEDPSAPVFSVENNFYRQQLSRNLNLNVWRNGLWGTFASLPLKPLQRRESQNASVSILRIGDLSALQWVERPSTYTQLHLKSEKVHVYYSALNCEDVMMATGAVPLDKSSQPEKSLGLEYSGVTSGGRRVMGIVRNEGLSLCLQNIPELSWNVPESWGLKEAATVPYAYTMSYYALITRGQMEPGESILIHTGAKGICTAAVAIALSMDCNVFTTIASAKERKYLKGLYPQLKDENIGNSNNTSFINMIMENTNGKGVDLVLNSLSGKLFRESLRCVAVNGRFLEIGIGSEFLISSKLFHKNGTCHGINTSGVFTLQPDTIKHIHELITTGINTGVVKPLPCVTFTEDQIETAFRCLSNGNHNGKVLIELRKDVQGTTKPPLKSISATPKVFFYHHKSYIIIGGLSQLGLMLAGWMIGKGARKIILNSTRQIHNGYQSYNMRNWSELKVMVRVNTDESSTLEGTKNILAYANSLGPIGGIFNTDFVSEDALMDPIMFRPMIMSGINMDVTTRTERTQLDHFVIFSPLTPELDTTYRTTQSALEQLCEKRRRENLPALVVQFNRVGEVGKLSSPLSPQIITSYLESLEQFMLQNIGVGTIVIYENKSKGDEIRSGFLADTVAHILSIRDITTINKESSLLQLGMDSLMLVELKQIFYRKCQMELSTAEVQSLNFSKLMEMGDGDKKIK